MLAYAALHDVAEVRVGDLTPHDGVPAREKARREEEALAALVAPLPARVADLWRAYEAQADEEARFVRQLDRLDMALQAVRYARASGEGFEAFVRSAGEVIDHPLLCAWLEAAREALGDATRRG